jgi:hypothetical protein
MLKQPQSEYYEQFERLSIILQTLKPRWDDGTMPLENARVMFYGYLNGLTDARSIKLWSGKISPAALIELSTTKKRRSKINLEHSWPKQIVIEKIFTDWYEHIKDPISLENLFFIHFGIFHITTKKENTDLIKHQRKCNFTTPENSYKAAGIELLDFSQNKRKLFSKPTAGDWIKYPETETIKKLIKTLNI